jgi:plastocyanin
MGELKIRVVRRGFLRYLSMLGCTGIMGILTSCRHEKKRLANERSVMIGGPKGELSFIPDRLRIAPGETVTWVLRSGGHTVTAYHPQTHSLYHARIPEAAKPWSSELLIQQGALFEWQFEIEGVYNYFCRPHESVGMIGAIIVGRNVDGPALRLPQPELPPLARTKLSELVEWAKKAQSPQN